MYIRLDYLLFTCLFIYLFLFVSCIVCVSPLLVFSIQNSHHAGFVVLFLSITLRIISCSPNIVAYMSGNAVYYYICLYCIA